METGVWLDYGGIAPTAALGDHGVEVAQGGEVPVGNWFIDQRPAPLGGLELGRVGRQENQRDPVGHDQALGTMPSGVVEQRMMCRSRPAPTCRATLASSASKSRLLSPVERYQTASPVVGWTKPVTCSHW